VSILKVLEPVPEVPNVDSSKLTYMRIGGRADSLVDPPTIDHLVDIIRTSRLSDTPFHILGKGSNVVFGNEVPGRIIRTQHVNNISIDQESGVVIADCGAYLTTVALAAKDNSLSGLEYVWEIPGSIGGAIYMNCGFRGHPISEIVKEVYALNPKGELNGFTKDKLGFDHRKSIFQTDAYKDWVILYAIFELQGKDPGEINKLMEENKTERRRKHPWGERSCGCIFVNKSEDYKIGGDVFTAHQLITGAGCADWYEDSIHVNPKYTPWFSNKNGDHSIDPLIRLINRVYHAVLDKYEIALHVEVKTIPHMELIR